MPAYLLHVRSAITLCHIEDDLDEFEQRFLPDDHYVLSRQGRSANYVIVGDEPLPELHAALARYARSLRLHQLSLVELGPSFAVSEQGCSGSPTEDACGEWRLGRNEESLEWEELRVRTGLDSWLRRHGFGRRAPSEKPIGFLLYFHHPTESTSRWVSNLRAALGDSARAHWHDDRSILITSVAPHGDVSDLLRSNRYARYFDPSVVHTVFCFTLAGNEHHTDGQIQSVWPPFHKARANRKATAPKQAPTFEIVRGKPPNPRAAELAAAIEKLKRSRR